MGDEGLSSAGRSILPPCSRFFTAFQTPAGDLPPYLGRPGPGPRPSVPAEALPWKLGYGGTASIQ